MIEIEIKKDNVNHPKHYEGSTSIECIEAMIIAFGPKETMSFCGGNAFKYLWRYKNKNGIEDLRKAKWYVNKFVKISVDFDVVHPMTNQIVTMDKFIVEKLKELEGDNNGAD